MRSSILMLITLTLSFSAAHGAATAAPHWGSISAPKAMMRVGPGRNFPAIWEYHRADLPVRVLELYREKHKNMTTLWRKVTDPDGATGWVQANLISETRTAVVRGGDPRPLRQAPNADAPETWRAEAGVVGRVSECGNGWCKLDVRGRAGYIETSAIWGVD